jgi:PQQ-dependent dehydrogenase (methanol/ethanol family)
MHGPKIAAARRHWMTSTAARACAFAAIAATAAALAPQPARAEWPAVNGADNQRYSPLSQINTKTVAKLGAAQVIEGIGPATVARTSAVVQDGMMFITSVRYVYAVDIASGKIAWKYDPGSPPARGGVAVGGGMVFVGAGGPGEANLVAINEKTGEQLWKAPLASPSGESTGSASGAPLYADGIVSIGTNADFGFRGQIVAVDAKTGKEAWRFYVVPSPGQPGSETWPKNNNAWLHGGGAIWLDGVYDPKLGVQFYGTGNAVPQYGGEYRQGDNLYTDSLVALDNKTGQLKWYYQIVHHDIWEADIAQAPVLFDAKVDGKAHKAIGAMRTDGFLFMVDRETGKPLQKIEERAAPQDVYQKTARTQPYPVGAQSVLPDCDYWKTQTLPAGFELGCFFTAASVDKQDLLAPVYGMRSTPMAYDPQTKFFYATGGAGLQWFRRSQDPDFYSLGFSGRVPGLGKLGYGVLAAIDTTTGKVAWQKQFREGGRPSGALTTGGGLLFQSVSNGELQAYDAKTGQQLWKFQLGTSAAGPPVAFEQGDQEYVATIAGGSVWLFKLGGALPEKTAPARPPSEDFSGPVSDKASIETTALIKDAGLTGQHTIQDEFEFEPFRTKVKAGAKVSWRNNGVLDHTIVAEDGSWSTDTLHPLDIGTHVFDKPGTYVYHSKEYPWQYGEIVVTP